ncbi:MAG: hypothetical protein KA902_06580 [Arenimonas sp.]|nr:hypothetical protein [Arenimonas sp.]
MQLINAETDGHLWAEIYDRELSAENIFAIQSEVTSAVTSALKAKLTDGEKAQLHEIPTKSLEAWMAYQMGKQRLANRNTQNFNEAEIFFRKAIDLDPVFVNAYAALIDTLRLKISFNNANPKPLIVESERYLKTAMNLDPNNAAVWSSAAGIDQIKGNYVNAEKNFRKAILLDPNYVPAYEWLSSQLSLLGKKNEALQFARKAVELDPLSALGHASLAEILDNSEMYDEALESYQRAHNLDPTISGVLVGQALILSYVKNRFVEALKLIAQAKALDPGLSSIQAIQLSLYFDLMEDELLRKALQDEIMKNPLGARDDTAIGLLSLIDGNIPEAMIYAQNTYKADPTNFWLLSTIYLYQGKPELSKSLYQKTMPEFFTEKAPEVNLDNYLAALDVAMIMLKLGDAQKANIILDGVSKGFAVIPDFGFYGDGILEVEVIALRGEKSKALLALRQLQRSGWHGPNWRYYRDIDPAFSSIRSEQEFKAIFADIEKDMLRQRELIKK